MKNDRKDYKIDLRIDINTLDRLEHLIRVARIVNATKKKPVNEKRINKSSIIRHAIDRWFEQIDSLNDPFADDGYYYDDDGDPWDDLE